MFIKNKRIMSFILFFAAVLLLFSLSSVSAASFNSGHSSSDIQNFIDTGSGDDDIILEEGDYIDTLYNLNVTRKVNIKSNGKVNIKSNTGGILFNVTARNVQILNLNISGYSTAIRSNIGGLSVIGNNITTNDISINISGSGDLSGISLENNTIISSVSSNYYGAVYVNVSSGSTVGISVKNNNITANNPTNSYGVRFNVAYCDNSLFFDNNNITGNSGDGVTLSASSSNNTVTLTNNNITGTVYGVYLLASSSNNTVTLTDNNITGTSWNGVELYAFGSNNTVSITDNNLTGGGYGVYLSASSSNNTVTFTDNNITGNAGDGVCLSASSSNNTVSLTDNNITGNSGHGVYLSVYGSNNSVSLTDNNITGTGYGVELYAFGSNNTVTFTDNNLTGNSGAGVCLSASSSNNTIIFTNSNITGTWYGVELYAFGSNNTVSLTNNNITGNSGYGVSLSASSSNNTVTFTDNNITGNSGDGVVLSVDSSNNTVTFTDNNITGNSGDGVVLSVDSSNNTVTFTDNNLTGGGYGVSLSASSSNNTITFTDNNITGNSGYGVVLYVDNSNNAVNFTDNNITGNSGVCVVLYASSSNNTITFTDNNITGNSGYGVVLEAYGSNNTITLTNNNITVNSGVCVVLYASSSNNTVTLTNNNITGAGFAVSLEAYGSNNTITLTDNNITGTGGVYLYVDSSNNTIRFTNNNITGAGYGVSLSVDSSNNTITFTDNNITGNSWEGIYLDAYSSNNTILSFIGNNITGIDYAMYIYSEDQFSGLSLLNNTFKSDDVGLHFVLNGAVLSDILVKGNTIFAVNKGIGFVEWSPSSVNLTVNYNRIIASIGLDFTTTDAGSNFDYNWWGVNDISSKIIGFDTNNHYILNITNLTSLNNVRPQDKLDFALLVLNTTLTNEGVENLPYFVITGLFNGESYNTTTDDLFVYQFTVPGEGIHAIDALVDDQYVFLEFNVSKGNTSSTIVVPDDARTGKTVNITGIATDDNGNPLANIQVTVTVDGVAYNVTTDSNGRWSLAYKPTHIGSINVSVSWTGNNVYNGFTNSANFNVRKGNISVVITVTENDDGSVTILANATDEDGDPVSGHPVDFVLDGKTVGHKVTDKDGIASITIPASKLTNGTHTITVIVGGGDNFNEGIASIEFTVTKNNNDTNDTNETNDNPATAGAAAMKKTGIPIIPILIVLISLIGISIRKKQN